MAPRIALRPARWIRLTVSLSLVTVALSGCGYSLGFRAPPGVATIAIPTFENQTFPLRRDLEFELTSLVREAVGERSGLRIVRDGASDLTVYGQIRDLNEYVVAEDRVDRKLESMVSIVVALRVEDYRSRTMSREVVRETEPLSITQGESLVEARRRALRGLARKILDHIQVYEADGAEGTP